MSLTDVIPFYPQWNFWLFELINSVWANNLFDAVMPLVRNKYFWLPLYVFITCFLLVNYKWKGLFVLVLTGASFGIGNTLSAEVMKPIFKQDRPCNHPVFRNQVQLRVSCGPGKSFPSSHATNHFAIALCLGLLLWSLSKWILIVGLFWAALVSYAQIYVGVHYPVDVMVGAVLGATIGALMALSWRKTLALEQPTAEVESNES